MTLSVLEANPEDAIAQRLIGRPYLSPSAVATFQRCPLKFYFSYVARLQPKFKSSSLLFGAAIHAAIEDHFRRLFAGEQAATPDELLGVFDEKWQAEAVGEIRFGRSETIEGLRELAGRMLRTFLGSEFANPTAELIGVEEQLSGSIVPGCPTILGRADLITRDESGVLRITDFKTSRTAWGNAKIDESTPQQIVYAELARPLAEALGVDEIKLDWLVLRKTKTPTIERHELIASQARVNQVKATIRRVWRAIQAGNFYPVPSAMNCSTCAFRRACDEWEG